MVTLDERVEAMLLLAKKQWPTDEGQPLHNNHHTTTSHHHKTYDDDKDPGKRRDGCYIRVCKDENCCLRCLRCLGQVPCPTLCCWVLMIMSVGACAGALMIGAIKARDMLEEKQEYVELSHWVGTGIILGMLLFSILFLIVAYMSNGKTSRRIFNSSSKNVCGRVLNTFMIIIMFLLQFIWILVCCILAVPLMVLIQIHLLVKITGLSCINLQLYGLYSEEKKLCGYELSRFINDSMEVLVCFAIALGGAILTVKSLTGFIMCASANYVHLRETRFSTYNVYRNDNRGGSHSSLQDTKM